MTAPALAAVLCLASSIYGRPAWDEAKCAERAGMILAAAGRHRVDPLLMVAIDMQECDQRDEDAPIYKMVRGKNTLVGYDACPMGVRIMGVARRAALGPAELYEIAAARLARWRRWCRAGHPGGRYPGHLHAGHHYSAHYNQGNPSYSHQVLARREVLAGKKVGLDDVDLTPRTRETLRRLQLAIERRGAPR